MAEERISCSLRRAALLLMALLCCWAGATRGDFASDQKECADSLVGLATCLTYVEGSSQSPTPDCCSGLKQVVSKSARCLCILIKDRNEPELGFKINVDRAATLPSLCGSPVNLYQCIDLLKLDPKSKDAEIFKKYGNMTAAGKAPDKGAPTSGSSPATGVPAAKPQDRNSGVGVNHHLGRWRWVGMEVVGGLWMSCVVVLSLVILGG